MLTATVTFAPVEVGLTDAGTEQLTPAGDPAIEQESATAPVNPFRAFAVTDLVPDPETFTMRSPSAVEAKLKSVVLTCTALERVPPRAEPVSCMFVVCNGVVPAVVPIETVELWSHQIET